MIFKNSSIDSTIVELLAKEAGKRGPQAWGVVFYQRSGEVLRYVTPGKLTQHYSEIQRMMPENTFAFIGQTRLATSGTYHQEENNQPLLVPYQQSWLALSHNGNVYNARQLTALFDVSPKTQCDSEVIGLCIDKAQGSLWEKTKKVMGLVDNRSPYALLLMTNQEYVAVSYGHPLYMYEDENCIAFCSRKFSNECDRLESFSRYLEK